MDRMRLDHVSYAAEHDGLSATAERLAKTIGVDAIDGGVHPRFGTRNAILPLAGKRYVEVVEVLDHPASYRAPFGQAVRARSDSGGGWLGWVVRVEDISNAEERVGRPAVDGYRHTPDGEELRWKQVGVKGLISDPQLPFYVQWDPGSRHPSEDAHTTVTIRALEIAGSPRRVHEWLGVPMGYRPETLDFTFVCPHGTPGLMSVTFDTPDGPVVV
jgi:hypothetical protein